jgi:hypothetical protein
MTSFGDLLGPPPVLLDLDEEPEEQLLGGRAAAEVAADFPTSSLAWATLAEQALDRDDHVTAYAYARTGYHRGLDQLRRQGWKGFGPVPYAHENNRGFLRAVAGLARAARAIGEEDEYLRCLDLVNECDPTAARQLGLDG